MKASSMEWEIDVFISSEQARQLKESPLVGTIRRNQMHSNKPFDEIPLIIQRGETSKENDCIDLVTTPEHVYWKKAIRYCLVLSDLAYSQIEERGATGERLYDNPACTIEIKVRD
jgi:hypothetical protein